jgi:hypothetical protein
VRRLLWRHLRRWIRSVPAVAASPERQRRARVLRRQHRGGRMKVPVVTQILKANDQVALENRARFDRAGVACSTSWRRRVRARRPSSCAPSRRCRRRWCRRHRGRHRVEHRRRHHRRARRGRGADQYRRQLPPRRAHGPQRAGPPGPGSCARALHRERRQPDLPGELPPGRRPAVVIASVAEGHDKPYKYPGIFAARTSCCSTSRDLIDDASTSTWRCSSAASGS